MRWVIPVLLSLAVAGCGDSGDATTGAGTTAGETSSREAYIARGDAVCERTNTRIAATNARISEVNRTATTADRAMAEAAPLLADTYRTQRASTAEFRAIPAPAGDEAEVDRIVAGVEEQVALVGRIADAAAAGDADRLRASSAELKVTRARVRALLQGYGFRVCGSA